MKWTFITLAVLAVAPAIALAQDQQPPANGSAVLMVKQSDELGAYLVDGQGRTLYTIVKEDSPDHDVTQGAADAHIKAEVVPCIQACEKVWPPQLTDLVVVAGDKVDPSLVHAFKRADGATQVVYGGYTLFYFARDKSPGDINGQGVKGFGGTWYAVSPDGEEIEEAGEPD